MQQAIVGFHLDEDLAQQCCSWVADLACGHTQHVRHDPPWQNRTWVCNGDPIGVFAMTACEPRQDRKVATVAG